MNDAASALASLSTRYVNEQFNPNTPDVAGVYYQSWGAKSGSGTKDRLKSILSLTHALITSNQGDNDGAVAVSSSKWGDFRGVLDADHLDLIGIKFEDADTIGFDYQKFLETTVSELASKGY